MDESLVPPEPRERDWFKWIPVAALFISVYNSIFATFILYPWHMELSREFGELRGKLEGCLPQ
jgi:hypothetical protein